MKKLKSSSIYYALFLSIMMAVVLGSMVLLSDLNRQFANRLDIEEILADNAHSGIEYGLANFAEIPNEQPLPMRLFNKGIDSVEIIKKQWGAFIILQSTAVHHNTLHRRIVLAGQQPAKDDPNLFVADQGRPISLCGDTRLEGKIQLPETGLKRAYIEGKNYTGDEMVYGTQAVSAKNLPPVDEGFIEQLWFAEGELRTWDVAADSISAPFSGEGIHFVEDGHISLQNIRINGQVTIESGDSIFVAASAVLDDVILKSPVVYIESGFAGTAQIFASEKIILENNVRLLYPSVLGLIEEKFPEKNNAEITIGEESQVIGSVFLFSREPNFRMPVQLNIASNSAVDGFVYCDGKTQLSGIVNGHLFTDKFYLKTKSSTYENHLLDAQVLDQLPEQFVYINLLHSENNLTRIKWLQ